MHLMKCKNKVCKSHPTCERFTSPPATQQSYASYWPERGYDKCENYLNTVSKKTQLQGAD